MFVVFSVPDKSARSLAKKVLDRLRPSAFIEAFDGFDHLYNPLMNAPSLRAVAMPVAAEEITVAAVRALHDDGFRDRVLIVWSAGKNHDYTSKLRDRADLVFEGNNAYWFTLSKTRYGMPRSSLSPLEVHDAIVRARDVADLEASKLASPLGQAVQHRMRGR